MDIFPDIELRQGKCVSLVRGEMDRPQPIKPSPLEWVDTLLDEGAEWLHVVDLDCIAGDGGHDEIVQKILARSSVPVQVGGGIRTLARAEELFEAGATRVVVGTAAILDPEFLRQLVTAHPRRVVVSLDCLQGRVAISGWKQITSYQPLDFVQLIDALDLAAVIFTDIDRDADMPESSLALTMQIAEAVKVPVITSGTIKTLDDIATVRYLPNIVGAVVGRALNQGTFTLSEALAVARQ